jgi:2'-5' RNA ligase
VIRLFAGLAPPDHIAEALKPCQQGLRGARWTPPENFHITLRFFGEIAEAAAEVLDDHLGAIRQAPFALSLAGAGVFGAETGRAAVFAALAPSEPLARLAGKCESAAQRAGLPKDPRTWRPHLTLAYLDGPPGPAAGAWVAGHNLLKTPPWRTDRFFLYSSRLGRQGPRYDVEREYPLR